MKISLRSSNLLQTPCALAHPKMAVRGHLLRFFTHKVGTLALCAVSSLALSSCELFEQQVSSSGRCETADGVINTYQLPGKWKRLDYLPPRTSTELQSSFDLLIVEPSGVSCLVEVSGGSGVPGAGWVGQISADTRSKLLDLEFSQANHSSLTASQNTALLGDLLSFEYRFQGSCESTRLVLSGGDDAYGAVGLRYQLFSTSVSDGDCGI